MTVIAQWRRNPLRDGKIILEGEPSLRKDSPRGTRSYLGGEPSSGQSLPKSSRPPVQELFTTRPLL